MDIKDLNKAQLILLAILLSFVTSIATGIVTVTLMQQAPASVTVPINRVIQQTVEKIQQVEGKTTVQTVVVKEEDLVVDAIAKNQSAVFSITKEVEGVETSAGRGFVVSNADITVADAVLVGNKEKYVVANDSGKFEAEIILFSSAISSMIFEGDPNIRIPLSRASAGGLVLNLEGEALGLALFNEVTPFASITTITEALKNIN